MTTGIRLSYAACFLQDIQSTWLLESKHLFHMDSGMLGHALSLDCTGFWNDINISSGVSDIFFFILGKETSSMVDFQNLRRGSICQQQGYQGTGKT